MASEQFYILKWNCHDQTLNQNLPIFLENDVLTDVTISVGTQHVRAHKVILAMCSVYFLQLFQEMPTSHPVVFLHSVTYDEMKAIISFMYKGQCIVSEEQLPSVLSVAKLLKIQGLCDMKVPYKQNRSETLIKNEEINANYKNELPRDYNKCLKETIPKTKEDTFENNNYVLMCDFNEESTKPCRTKLGRVSCKPCERTIRREERSNERTEKESVKKELPIASSETPVENIFIKESSSSRICKCFLCGKYLSNQYNLRVHMETHEEIFHACQSCSHISRSRDALRKHVSYRHPEEYNNRKRKKLR